MNYYDGLMTILHHLRQPSAQTAEGNDTEPARLAEASVDLRKARRLRYLEPTGNGLFISAWRYFLGLEFAFLVAGFLGLLQAALLWPDAPVNSATSLDGAMPAHFLWLRLFAMDWLIVLVLLVPAASQLALRRPWAILEETRLKLLSGRVIDLNDIAAISREGRWILFHYFPGILAGNGKPMVRVSGLKCLGQLMELEMTLRGMLLTSRHMSAAHVSMGKSTLNRPPVQAFVLRIVNRLTEVFGLAEVKEFPDRRQLKQIIPIWGALFIWVLFRIHPAVGASCSQAAVLLGWAVVWFCGLRILQLMGIGLKKLGWYGILILFLSLGYVDNVVGYFGENAGNIIQTVTHSAMKHPNLRETGTKRDYTSMINFQYHESFIPPGDALNLPASSPGIRNAGLGFTKNRLWILFSFTGNRKFKLNRETGLAEIVNVFGNPDLIRYFRGGDGLHLYYYKLNLLLHFKCKRLTRLMVHPTGFSTAWTGAASTSLGSDESRGVWGPPAPWYLGKTLIPFGYLDVVINDVAARRRQFPELYLLPQTYGYAFSPYRYPDYMKGDKVVLRKAAFSRKMILEMVFR